METAVSAQVRTTKSPLQLLMLICGALPVKIFSWFIKHLLLAKMIVWKLVILSRFLTAL
jgi:hypothetical protein